MHHEPNAHACAMFGSPLCYDVAQLLSRPQLIEERLLQIIGGQLCEHFKLLIASRLTNLIIGQDAGVGVGLIRELLYDRGAGSCFQFKCADLDKIRWLDG